MRYLLLWRSSLWRKCFSPLLGMTREPGGPWLVDAHVNMVIPEGWLCLIHPAINLLPMVQILSFPPHRHQQSRENHSINFLAVAGAAWQGGTALLRQSRDINFSLWAERITAVCSEAGKCMHACNRQLIIPMTAAGQGERCAQRPMRRLHATPAGSHAGDPSRGDFSAHGWLPNEDFLRWMLVFQSCAPLIWAVGFARFATDGCLKTQCASSSGA